MQLYDTARGEMVRSSASSPGVARRLRDYPHDSAHLQHAAEYLTFDMVKRRLRRVATCPRLVRNVIDVDDDTFCAGPVSSESNTWT
ncbi:MAG: hypothetical protein WBG41_08550 [Acidimicrobiales bacterium]